MSYAKIFCLFLFLFSCAVQGMELADLGTNGNGDNKQNTNLNLTNIVVIGSSSNGSGAEKKVVNNKEEMTNLIKVKSSRLPKKDRIVVEDVHPTKDIECIYNGYTPRERNVIDHSREKYNLTPEKLQLLAELKQECELDHHGLMEVMKKNVNDRDHAPQEWEKAWLEKKIK